MKLYPRIARGMGLIALLSGLAAMTASGRCQSGALVLPATISTLAGGATSLCASAVDSVGDGCPAGQALVGVATPGGSAAGDIQGIAIDPFGNVVFSDTANGLIRRLNRRSGIVSLVAGSTVSSAKVCAAATDKYGDGCPANDGSGNQNGGYTGNFDSPKGIAVGPNGNIYIAGYGVSLIQKISASTGLMTVVAGSTSPVGAKGSAVKGHTGDGGLATSATLNEPRGVAVDRSGDIYIADTGNNVVREVNGSTGIITTIAGSPAGTAGSTGDGGIATSALLNQPGGVAVDFQGNVYIADTSNKRIRVIYNSGSIPGVSSPVVGDIYTVAGGGTTSYVANTDVLATSVSLSVPRMLTVDAAGNLFLADSGKSIVWFLDAATDYMRPIAGTYGSTGPPATGCSTQTDDLGDGCPGLMGGFYSGSTSGLAVAVDAQENLFITDPVDQRLREVANDTSFPPQADGSSATQLLDVHFLKASGGPAATSPFTIGSGSTDFSVSSSSCNTNPDSTVDCSVAMSFAPSITGPESAGLYAGSALVPTVDVGVSGIGVAREVLVAPGLVNSFGSSYSSPSAVLVDPAGTRFVADTGHNQVLVYAKGASSPTRVIGSGMAGYSGDGGDAAAATLNSPRALAMDVAGDLFVADSGNNVIRRVDARTNVITTYAGGATANTLCGGASDAYGDGCTASQSILANPSGVAMDSFGVLYIADSGNQLIRAVSPADVILPLAGGASAVCSAASDAFGDGCFLNQTILNDPSQLFVEPDGNLLLADTGDDLVRRVNFASGSMAAVAGTGVDGDAGDNGPVASGQLNHPTGVTEDAAGDIYIADRDNEAVRMISGATPTLTTVAGQLGTAGKTSVPSSADEFSLSGPVGVALGADGVLYVADTGNGRVLADQGTEAAIDFGSVNAGATSSDQSLQVTNAGNAPASLADPLFTLSGDTGSFQLDASTSNGCVASQSLPAGNFCGLSSSFSPTTSGAFTAQYTFSNSTPASLTAPQIVLSGMGVVLTSTNTSLSVVQPTGGSPEYGETIVLGVTVSPVTGSGVPTGTVTFRVDGGSAQEARLSSGSATLSLSSLAVGPHTITADYGGDASFASSTAAPLKVTVLQAPAAVSLTAAPTTPINQFQSVAVTASVSSTTTGTPTGSVSFASGSLNLGTVNLSGGMAVLSTTALPVGTNTITATYSGDTNFQSQAATTSVVVNPDPADYTISLANLSLTVAQGGTMQTTFTITPTNTLVGRVNFSCAGLPVNSVCTFTPAYQNFDLSSDVPAQVTLTVWTNVSANSSTAANHAPSNIHGSTFALAALCFLPVLAFRRRRSPVLLSGLIGATCLGLLALSGCSSSAGSRFMTPPGTSAITITVSGPASQSHTATLSLTVAAAQ